ncbi:MAG: hypothetical protein PGN11_03145 [Quadrisphaera sp.]
MAVLRRWEAQHRRTLIDPTLAAWEDLDSEVVVRARQHWGLPLPSGLRYWSRRRYLSVDAAGAPERLIEVQLLSGHQPAVRARHSDLLLAGPLGRRYWIYALSGAGSGEVLLRTVQDPASAAWVPASPSAASGDHDPLWLLPLQRVTSAPVRLAA